MITYALLANYTIHSRAYVYVDDDILCVEVTLFFLRGMHTGSPHCGERLLCDSYISLRGVQLHSGAFACPCPVQHFSFVMRGSLMSATLYFRGLY